jgi:hypothetical protein
MQPMSTILFDRPACVFVRIRKSGSTSIVHGLFGGIDRAVEVRHGEFPESWCDRFSFAVVRNPYDRLVSAFLMFKTYGVASDDEASLRESLDLHRVLDIVEDPDVGMQGTDYRSKLKLHTAPYTHPFFCLDRVTHVARYERFEKEYRTLAGRLGIEQTAPPPHLRQTDRGHYRSYIDAALRRRIEQLYAGDLGPFGYKF